ncbi:hypothetical protein M569_04821 [Genlisea aurea]|uniref:RING-type E3 ubiquitin transferase n=1 Tax=Genlisea aurea TaxID=192259 RepID=S8CY51_9LAMI|nr:hypothetical protein M569_04821 [Genlisea aurea]
MVTNSVEAATPIINFSLHASTRFVNWEETPPPLGNSKNQWALNNPFNHRITSVVILYSAAGGVNKDYILTPLAPFHSSYVNEEKIKMLEKIEEARTDKILSQFVAFCGKVKAEVIKLEKDEVPLHQKILEMVSTHKITRLVLSLEFMKTVSSWKPRSAIAGAHYVLARKPHFCEVFLIWEGRLVFIRGENDEVLMESDGGVTIAKLRDKNRTVKKWLGRVFQSNVSESAGSFSSHNHWEKYGRDIEDYVNELSKQGDAEDEDDGTEEAVSSELLQNVVSLEEGGVEKIEILQDRIRRAQELVLFYKNKAIDDEERQEKANWAISICNNRVEELEASVSNEVSIKNNLNYEWNALKEEISRLEMEMEEKRNSLDSLLELHERLVDKLHLSSSAASLYEAMLEKEEGKRVDVLQRIEELRKQRDLFQLRVESGGDRGAASTDAGCLRRFSTMEISQATDNFSHHLRARDDDDDDDDEGGSAVYVGKIDRMTVSIKVFESQRRNDDRSGDAFARKVTLLLSSNVLLLQKRVIVLENF